MCEFVCECVTGWRSSSMTTTPSPPGMRDSHTHAHTHFLSLSHSLTHTLKLIQTHTLSLPHTHKARERARHRGKAEKGERGCWLTEKSCRSSSMTTMPSPPGMREGLKPATQISSYEPSTTTPNSKPQSSIPKPQSSTPKPQTQSPNP